MVGFSIQPYEFGAWHAFWVGYFVPSSPVSVTDERTSMVPASTGVGAAAIGFHLRAARSAHHDRSNAAVAFGDGENSDDFKAEGGGDLVGFRLGLRRSQAQRLQLRGMLVLEIENQPMNRVGSRLHRSVDQLADISQGRRS